ncbi:Uncharacterised protein [Mycobacterium tuberculosis]|nr:Uncharacterised protein [Mycobacterium tuberculosis]CNZ50794.1 Uncharacterised protein [Mycobacterium tuberculosis]COU74544.1 Uncharacterised protein [Mycobacterium tuberculosis]
MPLPPLAASTTHATVDPSGGTVTPLTPGSHAAGTAIGTGSTPGSTLTAGAVVAVERLPQPALPADAASLADATGGAGTPVPASLIPVAAVVGTVRTGVGVRNRAGVDPVCPGQTGATLPAGTTGPEPVGITAVAARAGHPAQDTRHGRPTLSAGTAIAQQHPAGTAITTGRPGPTQTPNTAIADQ